jgi:methionyl-tRNA synthetase
MINIEDFAKVEIKAGKILSVELVEGSEKLLKLSVDFGEVEPRQVVSGIQKYFGNPQELVGVKCAFVTNLEPRPIMGLVSEAMILAFSADSTSSLQADEKFSLMKVSESIPAGTRAK